MRSWEERFDLIGRDGETDETLPASSELVPLTEEQRAKVWQGLQNGLNAARYLEQLTIEQLNMKPVVWWKTDWHLLWIKADATITSIMTLAETLHSSGILARRPRASKRANKNISGGLDYKQLRKAMDRLTGKSWPTLKV